MIDKVKVAGKKDRRFVALAIAASSIALAGLLVKFVPDGATTGTLSDTGRLGGTGFESLTMQSPHGRMSPSEVEPLTPAEPQPASPADKALADARRMVEGGQAESAIRLLDSQREALRSSPQAYVLLGLALEQRGDPTTARDFFGKAIEMEPYYSEAYWGYATASERLGDLEGAIGAMRSFLHTDPNPDPDRLKIAQARSAIWEWEAQLGRGPWGPTGGIPPGLTAEQIKRDDKGVAILMPIEGTEKADGSAKFEIKAQSKFQLFRPD